MHARARSRIITIINAVRRMQAGASAGTDTTVVVVLLYPQPGKYYYCLILVGLSENNNQ